MYEVLEEYMVNEGMYSWVKGLRSSGFASKALEIAGIIKPLFKIKLDKSENIKSFWFIQYKSCNTNSIFSSSKFLEK